MHSVRSSWAENIHGSYFDGAVNYYLLYNETNASHVIISCLVDWGSTLKAIADLFLRP